MPGSLEVTLTEATQYVHTHSIIPAIRHVFIHMSSVHQHAYILCVIHMLPGFQFLYGIQIQEEYAAVISAANTHYTTLIILVNSTHLRLLIPKGLLNGEDWEMELVAISTPDLMIFNQSICIPDSQGNVAQIILYFSLYLKLYSRR